VRQSKSFGTRLYKGYTQDCRGKEGGGKGTITFEACARVPLLADRKDPRLRSQARKHLQRALLRDKPLATGARRGRAGLRINGRLRARKVVAPA
jgi:hypothetical protein